MAKLFLKKPSKRVPLRKKYKILKKVREHNRKVRKEAKKKLKRAGGSKNKVLHIPNLCPFKEAMLKEMVMAQKTKEEEKKARKEAFKEERKNAKKALQEKSLHSVAEEAEEKQVRHDEMNEEPWRENRTGRKLHDKRESMKKFYREFNKVVASSDVVLQVLDARDPLGTRSKEVEKCVLKSAEKRLVLILNKADLIPRDNLHKWLKYLQQFYPTIPFKSSTQQQRMRLSQRKKFKQVPHRAVQGSTSVGTDLLMSLLGNYCRNKDLKTSMTVGVVGIPNVGKSSIINSLKRSRSCHVGATPGVTRVMQAIHLDSKIKLLDCPGVVHSTRVGNRNKQSYFALKNAMRVENIQDPVLVATSILKRIKKEDMIRQYKMRDYSTIEEFFVVFAKRMGCLEKGGIPNTFKGARILINDWNGGKIKYYTVPPEDNEVHVSAQIVSTMAKEFDIESYEAMETQTISKLQSHQGRFIEVLAKTDSAVTPMVVENSVDDPKFTDDVAEDTPLISEAVQIEKIEKGKKRRKKKKNTAVEKPDSQLQLEGNQRLNKKKKLQFKKLKKEKIKRVRETSNLADTLESVCLGSSQMEDYDFEIAL